VIEVLVEWGDGTSGRSSGLVQSTRLTESVSRQHVYGAAGTYRMTVTACDADGACRQAFLTVSVRAAATPTPVPPASGPTPPPVGTLPATGSQTAGPLRLAMLTLIAGVALSALGARRRRPA
jgi:LPXTG-motif cell wall-anchored protein